MPEAFSQVELLMQQGSRMTSVAQVMRLLPIVFRMLLDCLHLHQACVIFASGCARGCNHFV